MSARQKLNVASTLGALILAAVVGAVFESVVAFLIVAAILIALAVHDGGIRFNGRR